MIRPRLRLGPLCILTLPIFVVVTFEMIFSFYVADSWSYVPQDRSMVYSVAFNRGRVIYTHFLLDYQNQPEFQAGWTHDVNSASYLSWLEQTIGFKTTFTFLGFLYHDQPATQFRVIVIPLWPIVVLSAIPTMLWIRVRRSPTRFPGHCRQCGYDLRASKDRCPECGTPIALDEGKPASIG